MRQRADSRWHHHVYLSRWARAIGLAIDRGETGAEVFCARLVPQLGCGGAYVLPLQDDFHAVASGAQPRKLTPSANVPAPTRRRRWRVIVVTCG